MCSNIQRIQPTKNTDVWRLYIFIIYIIVYILGSDKYVLQIMSLEHEGEQASAWDRFS